MAAKKSSRKRKVKNPKSVAQLLTYAADGTVVSRQDMPLLQYYEGSHKVIDSAAYRRQRGIVRVTGKLYDSRGTLVEEFDNEYQPDGAYKKGRAKFEDGTVQEN
jgi:hypothetical protein